jgi:hypothetical protein
MTHAQLATMKRAAANRHNWGRYAARQHALNNGVPLWAYRLACQLEAMK